MTFPVVAEVRPRCVLRSPLLGEEHNWLFYRSALQLVNVAASVVGGQFDVEAALRRHMAR